MNSIRSTGSTATISISGGQGNTKGTEVWVHLRAEDGESENTKAVYAWFPADQILDALHDAIELSKEADERHAVRRLTEPAA